MEVSRREKEGHAHVIVQFEMHDHDGSVGS